MKVSKEKIKLCPNCKTGYEMLRLDPKEPVCPYLHLHNGENCTGFVPLNSVQNEGDKKLTEK